MAKKNITLQWILQYTFYCQMWYKWHHVNQNAVQLQPINHITQPVIWYCVKSFYKESTYRQHCWFGNCK